MKRSLYWYIRSLHILVNTYTTAYSSHRQKIYKQSVYLSLFNKVYSVSINKDDLTKESGYQRGIISKTFKRITNDHSLYQLQKQT